MQADELENRLPFLSVKIETGEECICQFDALAGVFTSAACFAGVVQQQGQQEEVETIDLRQQLGQAMLEIMGGLAKAMDVVDGEEGVLVDRVR